MTGKAVDDLDQIAATFVDTPLAGLPIGHGPSGAILVGDVCPTVCTRAGAVRRCRARCGRSPGLRGSGPRHLLVGEPPQVTLNAVSGTFGSPSRC
ncbi:hypothetical protein [Micromonospora sp. NPDC050276]|uniref:hypothetical protein n=1 Tax=Micromonospora sp. NPDC050276 TaxID=3364278 RepID=UPI0037ABA210